jgi:phosphatidylglycerophosphate synthase
VTDISRIVASQKPRDTLKVFWLRRVSPGLTRLLLATPISANQTTVLWGALGVLNSALVYLAVTGSLVVLPVVALVYTLCDLIDCVDGEIARYRNQANPVGGKLLDGVCHRAIEYSLVAAYVAGARSRG